MPLNQKWIKKMCHIYTMEYYSDVKSNDHSNLAGKWMELEKKITQSDVTQTQKDKHGMYSLIGGY